MRSERCAGSNVRSWKIPCADGLAHLFESEHVIGERLAIGELVGAIGAFGIEIVEQAGGAAVVGVFADVARLLGLIDVAAAIELNDLIVGVEIFVRRPRRRWKLAARFRWPVPGPG